MSEKINIAYIRRSQKRNDQQTSSINFQKQRQEELMKEYRIYIDKVVIEEVSAKTP